MHDHTDVGPSMPEPADIMDRLHMEPGLCSTDCAHVMLVPRAVNLAVALATALKLRVGLLDADIHGPSIGKMMNLQGKPAVSSGGEPTAQHWEACASRLNRQAGTTQQPMLPGRKCLDSA